MSELALSVPGPGFGRDLLRTARPAQWARSLLVLALPAIAGTLGDPETAGRVALAFVAFSLASSGVSFLGDARLDHVHPVGTALVTGLILSLGALAAALAVGDALGGLVAASIALGVFRTLRLRPALAAAAATATLVACALAGAVVAG